MNTNATTPATNDPAACKWCGEPLPPRPAGTPGRPATTHAGDCRRKYRNRYRLEWRIEAFRAAHRREAFYADLPWAAPFRDVAIYDEARGRYALPDHFSEVDPDPTRGLYGKALMDAIERWEESLREQQKIQDQLREILPPRPSILDGMTEDEIAEVVRRATARRLRRAKIVKETPRSEPLPPDL